MEGQIEGEQQKHQLANKFPVRVCATALTPNEESKRTNITLVILEDFHSASLMDISGTSPNGSIPSRLNIPMSIPTEKQALSGTLYELLEQ